MRLRGRQAKSECERHFQGCITFALCKHPAGFATVSSHFVPEILTFSQMVKTKMPTLSFFFFFFAQCDPNVVFPSLD